MSVKLPHSQMSLPLCPLSSWMVAVVYQRHGGGTEGAVGDSPREVGGVLTSSSHPLLCVTRHHGAARAITWAMDDVGRRIAGRSTSVERQQEDSVSRRVLIRWLLTQTPEQRLVSLRRAAAFFRAARRV